MLFYLFRHGQTIANAQGIIQGSSVNYSLDETGREQAAKLRDTLSALNLPVIYSSKMLRAIETAEIVASGNNAKVIPIDGLQEVCFGDAENMPIEDCHLKYKDILDIIRDTNNPRWRDVCIPNGESINQSLERALKALYYIKEHHHTERVAVATHGALLYNLYEHFYGLGRRFANCEYFVVAI